MRPRAKELRRIARNNQNKQYWWAVLVTWVALLLGATSTMRHVSLPTFSFNLDYSTAAEMIGLYDEIGILDPDAQLMLAQFLELLRDLAPLLAILAVISAIASLVAFAALVIGGPISWGYTRYCLQNHDAQAQKPFGVLFSGFQYFGKTVGLFWYLALRLFLWSLLIYAGMIVGILLSMIVLLAAGAFTAAYISEAATLGIFICVFILVFLCVLASLLPMLRATYAYSMSYYLMVENPDLPVTHAVRCSVQLMQGHKWRLFCLDFSFIGWDLLNSLTLGILGILFLNPYKCFARTAFYRDLVPAAPQSWLWREKPQYNYYAQNGYGQHYGQSGPQGGYRPPQGGQPVGYDPNTGAPIWQQPVTPPTQPEPVAEQNTQDLSQPEPMVNGDPPEPRTPADRNDLDAE